LAQNKVNGKHKKII